MQYRRLKRLLDRLEARFQVAQDQLQHRRQPWRFGQAWMQKYLPHYVTAPASKLHLDLADDLSTLHTRRGTKLNRRAPRGAGKSSWSTKGYAIYCICEGVEEYIFILSEASEQSNQFVTDIAEEIAENEHIAKSYPHVAGKGRLWRTDKFKSRNGVMVQGRGVGGKIRGLANKNVRPTLVITDDPNGDDDAFSPTSRRRKLTWFAKAVMNIGDPNTNFLVLGTPIHREAIVCQLAVGQMASGWETKAYRSILRWPDRMDLWHHWEALRSNLGDPNRTATSDAFYEANREAMNEGAEVLWPEREPLEQLMAKRAGGHEAFGCEKQDIVGQEGSTEWPMEYFERPDLWFFDWPDDLTHKIQVLDPSKGSGDTPGDYQAHVQIGLGKDGLIYVDAALVREDSRKMVEHGLDMVAEWHPYAWCFEDNGTMGLLFSEIERQLEDRAKAGKALLVNYESYTSSDSKGSRIRHVGGYLSRGQVRFRNTPGARLLVEQLREWPNADHDDGPDACGVGIRRLERLVNEGN
jgi:predicted phage terminase large subunit-like protein